jgi:hypothetical protein
MLNYYRLGAHALNCIFAKNRNIVRFLDKMQFAVNDSDLLDLEEATRSLNYGLKLFVRNKD